MTIGSLFSGIGGLELGLERAGLGPVAWQVEKDPFCRSVLAKHWPDVEKHEDVRTAGPLARVDLICGGFPCQDVSSAGKGAGLDGERSGLWREFRRIVSELRPALSVVENVASGARRWLPFVRRDLHLLGYRTRAFAFSASDVGAPHLRRRIFVVAADPERIELRDEPRWRGRPRGQGSALAADHGADRNVGDADRRGEQEQGQLSGQVGGRAADAGWWASEPEVGRVADGVPGRMVRLRALGNAVVPQCAEAIGRMIKSWDMKGHGSKEKA